MGRSPESPFSSYTSPTEQAFEAQEDLNEKDPTPFLTQPSAPPPTQLASRRKSSTWKGLKRQLSRVDIKLKNPLKEKRHSIFYSGVLPGNDVIDQVGEDPENNIGSQDSVEEVTVVEQYKSPTHQLIDNNDQSTQSSGQISPEPDYILDLELDQEIVQKLNAMRPDNLDLVDDYGSATSPIRPPRGVKKKALKRELLSVPNNNSNKSLRTDGQVVKDLRDKEDILTSPQPSFTESFKRRFSRIDKLDCSFSRSRSSSMSSLDNITSEAIQCLVFADTYSKKTEPSILTPTLWVGTSLGSVLPILITPPEPDSRSSQPVVVSMVGTTIFRLKGSIITLSFLDYSGALIPYTYEAWKDDNREKRDRTPTRNQNRMSPTLGENSGKNDNFGDRQFVVIASQKQARVVALPSQSCIYKQQLADSDFVIKAEVISFKDSVCLVTYVSNGHLMAYSLPSLRPMLDIDFLPLSELSFQTPSSKGIVDPMLSIWGQQLIVNEDTDQIARTFGFSNKGNGLYLASPSELQKFTLCADFCSDLTEMLGDLFLSCEMPELPKQGIFKSFFKVGVSSLDREELFGESSGRANKSVAKHIPGNMQDVGQRASSACSEVNRAHKLMLERGEKLSQLEEKSERMRNEAENFSSTAHELMLKHRDKKWYQL